MVFETRGTLSGRVTVLIRVVPLLDLRVRVAVLLELTGSSIFSVILEPLEVSTTVVTYLVFTEVGTTVVTVLWLPLLVVTVLFTTLEGTVSGIVSMVL